MQLTLATALYVWAAIVNWNGDAQTMGIEKTLAKCLQSHVYATTDVSEEDLTDQDLTGLLCVKVPVDKDGNPDLPVNAPMHKYEKK